MNRKNLLATIVGMAYVLASATTSPSADRRDVQTILDEYAQVRPTDADLALYRLDWSPTFEDARAKASKERRPILLIVVLNSFGDLRSGHC